jgi:hypothetical protein
MHNGRMRTHADIIRDAGPAPVADLTGVSIHTVRSWVQRDSIPSEYWSALVRAEHAKPDELIEAAAKKAA